MLEPVLAMYSVPSSPLYREFGSGLLTQDSLKATGVYAQRKSELGWLTILAKSGDKSSQIDIIKKLTTQYGALVSTVAIFSVIPKICTKCNGTKVYKWKSGNIRDCTNCIDGKISYQDKELCENLNIEALLRN